MRRFFKRHYKTCVAKKPCKCAKRASFSFIVLCASREHKQKLHTAYLTTCITVFWVIN